MRRIRYALYRNERIAGRGRYVARVLSNGTLTKEDVLEQVTHRNTTVTYATGEAVWEVLRQVTLSALLEGWIVTTPWGLLRLTARGLFESYSDRFDARRHRIVAHFQVDPDVQRVVLQQARPERVEADELRPSPRAFHDVASGEGDRVLTPGSIGRLSGDRLKFDPDDPRQGLFILGADGSITRVTTIAENRPRKLIFLIPPLPQGAYKLAVRAAIGGGQYVDVGFLGDVLQVAPSGRLLEEPAGPFPEHLLRLPEPPGGGEDD